MNTIYFYNQAGRYGEFSNFYPLPVVIDGKSWSTTEHYFQAMKFSHIPDYMEQIRLAPTPGKAKQLGSTRKFPIRNDWEAIKEEVMLKALQIKFSNENMKAILLSTGNSYLVENTTNDYYWGCGTNNGGKNRLGILLMKVREKIKIEYKNLTIMRAKRAE